MFIACNVLFPEEIKKFCIHAVYAVMEKCSDADDRDPVKCLQEMDKVFKAMKLKIYPICPKLKICPMKKKIEHSTYFSVYIREALKK